MMMDRMTIVNSPRRDSIARARQLVRAWSHGGIGSGRGAFEAEQVPKVAASNPTGRP